MQFLALDFETATPAMDSPCELGIAVVRDGVVSEVRNWLIKPPQWPHFSPFNMAVHGIRPEEVADSPTWPEIWSEVAGILDGATVVAHNAGFDMTVLRGTLASHRLAHPAFRYFCSVSMARRIWPGHRSYGLSAMCQLHAIPLRHHRASHDAEATAELVLRAAGQARSSTIDELLESGRVKCGSFFPGGQRTPSGKLTEVRMS